MENNTTMNDESDEQIEHEQMTNEFDWDNAILEPILPPFESFKGQTIVASEVLSMEYDWTPHFPKDLVFETRDKMKAWIRDFGYEHKMTLVVKKSDQKGRNPRVVYSCERSGKYKLRTKSVTPLTEEEKKKKKKNTGTRKCDCPFEVKFIKKQGTEDCWMLDFVKCGVHNHTLSPYIEGHAQHSKLKPEELSMFADLNKGGVKPKKALGIIKEKYPANCSSLQTLYNVKKKLIKESQDGRTKFQQINKKTVELIKESQDGRHCVHDENWKVDVTKSSCHSEFSSPMRSLEIKNRTSTEDIESLRLITAIKTPYLPDGRFDLEAYDALMHMQIVNGVEGVIVGGTTGEGHLMSWDEHIMLIGHTVNCFGGSIKVIGNTGSNSTREAIHASEQGFAVGMHAALHINPYYGKTSLDGLVSHFDAVLSMGPTIIYNVPSRTGQDIPPSVIHRVAKNANFAGIKECVGNDRIEEYTDEGIVVWSGNDDQCHDARWNFGAVGVVSVTSNLVPGLMRELMFASKNTSLNSRLMPLMEWLFREPNPIGMNTALAQLGVVRPVFRLPYVPLSLARRVEFVNIVQDLGRENFVGERDVQVLKDDDFILVGRY